MYRVLGPLVIGDERHPVAAPTGIRQSVLALLLLNANRVVPTRDLLRAVWGSDEVDETQLHKCISRLRSSLGEAGRRDDLVTHPRLGYELRVAVDDLDKLAFERLVRQAESVAATGLVDDEISLLRDALGLWRGPRPIEGVPGDLAVSLGEDLRQRRKRAFVRLCDLELGRGNHDRILDELRAMAREHPTDARLAELLMTALRRGHHGAEAIAAYEEHAAALAAETGGKPESHLRDLAYAIGRADEEEPAASRHAVPLQLPAAPSQFVGREDELAEASWLLRRDDAGTPPVVVVTGPGGSGKTTLALKVAYAVRARYPDGQLFVELGGTQSRPAAVVEVLAQCHRAFGVTKVPETLEERASLYRTLLGNRRVLVVLDDARNEAQVRALIPGNARCGVLITSRNRLPDLDGVFHIPTVEPLDLAHGVELFERIVHGPANRAESEQVVELCAGLPLAIRIAAALRSAPGRTTRDLVRRLRNQRLDTLVYGDRSVARSIGAGFDLLDDDAKRLFLGLGAVDLHDFGVWTAAAILGPGADPEAALQTLAGCHMLSPSDRPGRFRFHDLTREYAENLADAHVPAGPSRSLLLELVYGALLTLARRAHYGFYGGAFEVVHGTTPTWADGAGFYAEIDESPEDWWEAERANIRAAVHRTAREDLSETCWDLAVSAHEFYNVRGYLDDWYATHLIALDACERTGNLRGEAAVLTMLGQPALVASGRDGVSGVDKLTRAVQLFDRCGDPHGKGIALRTLANTHRREGRFVEAVEAFKEAVRLFEDGGDTVGRWQALRYIGQIQLDLGRNQEALIALATAQEVAAQVGQPRPLMQTAYWLGCAYAALGRSDVAEREFRYVLGQAGGDPVGCAYADHGLGEVALMRGDIVSARAHLESAIERARTGGDAVLEGRANLSLAAAHAAIGHLGDREAALRAAASCFTSVNATYLLTRTMTDLA